MKLIEKNPEVFVAVSDIVEIGETELSFLKAQVLKTPRKRARICAHREGSDALHEMIIVISEASYIHPHRHVGKSESFHIIDGKADVVIFDDTGDIETVVELGPRGSGRHFFYRLSRPLYHTVVLRSEMLVMHEVTNGPFNLDDTDYASFAPKEDDVSLVKEYSSALNKRIEEFFENRGV